MDVFGWARSYCGSDIEVTTCGFNKAVTGTFGVSINADITIDDIYDTDISDADISEYQALAVPGGFGEYGFYEEAYDEKFLELIRKFADAGKPIASVCVAAKPLAGAGVLKGRKATTYHLDNKKHQRQLAAFEGVTVIPNESIVTDGNIITSFCPQTASYVALKLLAMLKDEKIADETGNLMGF